MSPVGRKSWSQVQRSPSTPPHLGPLASGNSVGYTFDEKVVCVEQVTDSCRQAVVHVPPVLAGLDKPTVAQTCKVLAGAARTEGRGRGKLARGRFAVAERLQKRQTCGIGQPIEEAGPHEQRHTGRRLRHLENDTPFTESEADATWQAWSRVGRDSAGRDGFAAHMNCTSRGCILPYGAYQGTFRTMGTALATDLVPQRLRASVLAYTPVRPACQH